MFGLDEREPEQATLYNSRAGPEEGGERESKYARLVTWPCCAVTASCGTTEKTPSPTMSDDTKGQVVILRVEGESIMADRARLCSSSPYFSAMFGADFVEKGKGEVELSCVTAAAVRELLRRASCLANNRGSSSSTRRRNKPGQDDEGLTFDLLQAAGMLQFESARVDCADRLASALRPAMALETLSRAELLAERRLAAAAARVALWHFELACEAEFLPQVPFETMGRLLCDVRLNVKTEISVLEVVGRWWMGGEEGGIGRLPRNLDALLGCVRFSKVGKGESEAMLDRWRQNSFSDLLIEKVKRGCEGGLGSTELAARRPPVFPAVIATKREGGYEVCTIDCDKRMLEGSEVVLCEDMIGNWDVLEGFRVLPVAGGSRLYLTGGEFGLGRGDWNMAVVGYDVLTDRWEEAGRLGCPRRHHGAAVDEQGKKVAVVGGFGRLRDFQASGEVIDLESGQVVELPNLPEGVKSPACCYFKGSLYVIKRKVYKLEETAEGTKSWKDLGVEVAPKHDFVLAVTSDDQIYLTSKHDYKLFRLDLGGEGSDEGSHAPSLKEVESGQFKYETQNLCLVSGVIYNFSSDQFGTTSCVESFDPSKGTFEVVWEGETETAQTPIDFSPYYSLGCFPIVQY